MEGKIKVLEQFNLNRNCFEVFAEDDYFVKDQSFGDCAPYHNIHKYQI